MSEEKAIEIIDSEFDFEDETDGQRLTLISLLCKYGRDEEEIINARKNGIKFTLDVIRKHGTAKTFDSIILKELNK